MKSSNTKIKNKENHRVADYDRAARTILITRKGCLTAIRILPDGRLEVDGKIVA